MTPPRPAEEKPEPAAPAPEAVAGELVDDTAAAGDTVTVVPTPSAQAQQADRARGRTAVQVGTPAALLAIATWLLRLAEVDLDPGAGVDMPAEVAGAWVAILGVVLAFRMNPRK